MIYVANSSHDESFFTVFIIIKISAHEHRKIQFWCVFNYFITSSMQNLLWQPKNKQLLTMLLMMTVKNIITEEMKMNGIEN